MRSNILILSHPKLTQLVKQVTDDMNQLTQITIKDVQFGRVFNFLDSYLQFDSPNFIITAGAHWSMLNRGRRKFSTPVIPFPITRLDLLKAALRGRRYGLNIALVYYGNELIDIEELFADLDCQIQVFSYQTEEEVRFIIQSFNTSRINAIMGTGLVCAIADDFGIPSVFIHSKESIMSTLEHVIQLEAARVEMMEASKKWSVGFISESIFTSNSGAYTADSSEPFIYTPSSPVLLPPPLMNMEQVRKTVKDVLQYPDCSTRLVAGNGGIHNPVRWVHMGRMPDMIPELKGGELILVIGSNVEEKPELWPGWIQSLSKNGAAGVVLELNQETLSLPQALLEVSDRHEFPVLVLEEGVRFVEWSERINRMLVMATLGTPVLKDDQDFLVNLDMLLFGDSTYRSTLNVQRVFKGLDPFFDSAYPYAAVGVFRASTGESLEQYLQEIRSWCAKEKLGFIFTAIKENECRSVFIFKHSFSNETFSRKIPSLLQLHLDKGFSGGLSRPTLVENLYSTGGLLSDRLQEALVTRELVSSQPLLGSVYTFNPSSPYTTFYELAHNTTLPAVHLINPLFDQRNADKLLTTLRLLLDHGFSITVVASHMGTTRQTVYALMQKLESLLGLLSDPEKRFALSYELRIEEMRNALQNVNGEGEIVGKMQINSAKEALPGIAEINRL